MRHAIKMIGLVLVLTLSACDDQNGENLGRFIGTWRVTSGTATSACPGYAPSTSPLTGNTVWSAGISSDLTMTFPDSSCALMADVSGATASGVPGQSCTASDATGTATVTFAGYTFVIAADGQTATENVSGNVTYVIEGVSFVCSFNQSGSYQKISN
jgi:hypothetical protein